MIFCGIDWAERTHDVALVDDSGQLLAKRHITDDAAGYRILLDLLAEYGDTEESPIPVAIETSRGLLVAVLRTGRRQVFAINPMAAARYRDRHSVSRKKSDPGDALVLANVLRTDMHAHRPLPNDSDLAQAVAVLTRAQQDATWNRQQIANQLRSLLREYYPAALAAVEVWKNGLCRPEAHEILRLAPTPAKAARLTRTQLQAALKRAGRQRGIAADAERLRTAFRADWARQPELVEAALGKQMLALLIQLEAACTAADNLAEAVEEAFPQHPDAEIILSFPGLGTQLGARVLAEIGDDRKRFADARGLKAYAGASPITRASGKKSSITRRWVKNNRLNHAGYLWAFSAITASPGAKAHYRRRRDNHADWHAAAQRNLFNRMIGQLYHCLKNRELFDEESAFPAPPDVDVSAA
ncbi:IS110 family transposase [Streptomyces sp. XY413]|uniref:IS110 family transposase n=1 Tax=Streptomyces TaxID=1883 RepID=UPI0006AEE562|nr:IS110 family transposase [Streptomyces sp. XY413]KOV26314.1 transposase [Streptomyces sp. XY413]